jgi:hypothetical protein
MAALFEQSQQSCYQGDQIGRIFAQWKIVYFWQFFEN